MIFYSSALTDSMWVFGLQEPSKFHSKADIPFPFVVSLFCWVYDLLHSCFPGRTWTWW